MVDVIIISWIIGGATGILMFYAAFITFKASKKLAGELKTSVLLLVGALSCYLFMGFLTGIMAVKDIHYSENIWLTVPSLALIGALFFVIGSRKLFNVLLGVSEEEKKINNKEVKR
jgi:hypothetical protein